MKVVSFYRFLDVLDPEALRDELQALCDELGLLGTVLVATEGFNGTIAGTSGAVSGVFRWLQKRFDIDEELDARWTSADEAPFRRMRVRVKKDIVTLGRPDLLPHRKTGEYVAPEKWNELIGDPNVLLIDTRVPVDRDLAEGGYVQCHACRRPLSSEDLAPPDYREGVSCPKCINEADEDRLARLEERRKQVRLAAERGEAHIGANT